MENSVLNMEIINDNYGWESVELANITIFMFVKIYSLNTPKDKENNHLISIEEIYGDKEFSMVMKSLKNIIGPNWYIIEENAPFLELAGRVSDPDMFLAAEENEISHDNRINELIIKLNGQLKKDNIKLTTERV